MGDMTRNRPEVECADSSSQRPRLHVSRTMTSLIAQECYTLVEPSVYSILGSFIGEPIHQGFKRSSITHIFMSLGLSQGKAIM
jgi:hypothetical protein